MESKSLANKYRPTTLEEVIGQEHVVDNIRGMLKSGRIAPTILFSGPYSSGKTSFSRLIARYLVCRKSAEEPCGECPSCKIMLKAIRGEGEHPDVVEINAASNRGIGDIRDLKQHIAYAPRFGRFRVYIFDEAHQITKDAFQAALKIFEEPPPRTRFILCTTNPELVPRTILSRCQRYHLNPVTVPECYRLLARVAKAEELHTSGLKKAELKTGLKKIAEISAGHPRDALTLLSQLRNAVEVADGKVDLETLLPKVLEESESYASYVIVQQYVDGLFQGRYEQTLAAVQKAMADSVDLVFFLNRVITTIQQILYTWVEPSRLPISQNSWYLKGVSLPNGHHDVAKIQDIAKLLDIFLGVQERSRSYASQHGLLDMATLRAIAVTSSWSEKPRRRKGE